VYDPAKDGNGLPFEQLPDTWKCPVCGAPKSAYKSSILPDGRKVWMHEDADEKVKAPETTWTCSVCGHVYDPAKDGNGLPFEQLPDTWKCPVCGAPKSAYKSSILPDGRKVWMHEEADERVVNASASQQCQAALDSTCKPFQGKGQFCQYCEARSYRKLEDAGCSREDLYYFCNGNRYSCNASVGRVAVVDNMSVQRVPQAGSSRDYDFWNYNMAQKTQGFWYSTLTSGQCNSTGTGPCYWRIVEKVKTVKADCQRATVYSTVQKAGAGCFSTCPMPLDNTTKCWADCYFDTILGQSSSSTVIKDPTQGMSLDVLSKAWTAAFQSDDPTTGGCPAV